MAARLIPDPHAPCPMETSLPIVPALCTLVDVPTVLLAGATALWWVQRACEPVLILTAAIGAVLKLCGPG